MHIRITRKYHYTPTRWLNIQLVISPNADVATGRLGHLHIVGGNVKCIVTLENSLAVSFKKQNELFCPRGMKIFSH